MTQNPADVDDWTDPEADMDYWTSAGAHVDPAAERLAPVDLIAVHDAHTPAGDFAYCDQPQCPYYVTPDRRAGSARLVQPAPIGDPAIVGPDQVAAGTYGSSGARWVMTRTGGQTALYLPDAHGGTGRVVEFLPRPVEQAERAFATLVDGFTADARRRANLCVRCTERAAVGACCSSHNKALCHGCYRRTHFVEVCSAACVQCAAEGLSVVLGRATL